MNLKEINGREVEGDVAETPKQTQPSASTEKPSSTEDKNDKKEKVKEKASKPTTDLEKLRAREEKKREKEQKKKEREEKKKEREERREQGKEGVATTEENGEEKQKGQRDPEAADDDWEDDIEEDTLFLKICRRVCFVIVLLISFSFVGLAIFVGTRALERGHGGSGGEGDSSTTPDSMDLEENHHSRSDALSSLLPTPSL